MPPLERPGQLSRLVQMAPAYQTGKSHPVIERIHQIGEPLGFEELPSRREFISQWKEHSFRYHTLSRSMN